MQQRCKICKGNCGKYCKVLASFKQFQPKVKLEFSGSAFEIFVGRHNYPQVFTGILSPEEYGSTEKLSMPERWFEEQASIERIMQYRSQMIYSRFQTQIKGIKNNRLIDAMQEIALASRPVATEFKLKKEPQLSFRTDGMIPVVGNPAPLKEARLEENPHVGKKVDYLTSDYDINATHAIRELYNSRTDISNIIKVLAAGLLGMKLQRKLVPSRWATTAVDDTVSKILLERIKTFSQISEFMLFHGEYLGNHYEIILMPEAFGFEVIEARVSGGGFWQDYEFFHGRKEYASDVTGAYYANRLAVAEYLVKIKKQASCLFLREVRDEYWAPCGVGILREVSRNAFTKMPERFQTLAEALQRAQSRMKMNVGSFTQKSKLIENAGTQRKLQEFFSVKH